MLPKSDSSQSFPQGFRLKPLSIFTSSYYISLWSCSSSVSFPYRGRKEWQCKYGHILPLTETLCPLSLRQKSKQLKQQIMHLRSGLCPLFLFWMRFSSLNTHGITSCLRGFKQALALPETVSSHLHSTLHHATSLTVSMSVLAVPLKTCHKIQHILCNSFFVNLSSPLKISFLSVETVCILNSTTFLAFSTRSVSIC